VGLSRELDRLAAGASLGRDALEQGLGRLEDLRVATDVDRCPEDDRFSRRRAADRHSKAFAQGRFSRAPDVGDQLR
jgi:hypothetical protein